MFGLLVILDGFSQGVAGMGWRRKAMSKTMDGLRSGPLTDEPECPQNSPDFVRLFLVEHEGACESRVVANKDVARPVSRNARIGVARLLARVE
nr:hypothetical protein CFP56_70097 [Quercus suber]